MIHTDVHIRLPDGDTLLCGEMVTNAADFRGAMRGAFRYSGGYLIRSAAGYRQPT